MNFPIWWSKTWHRELSYEQKYDKILWKNQIGQLSNHTGDITENPKLWYKAILNLLRESVKPYTCQPCVMTTVTLLTETQAFSHSFSYSWQSYTPFIVIVFKSLLPIHCHSLCTVHTPSANSIYTPRYGLSVSISLAILLIHIFMAWPGPHRQPYYWDILSRHFQFSSVSLIVSFHVFLWCNPSYLFSMTL